VIAPALFVNVLKNGPKLCLRILILLLFFSDRTPLHHFAQYYSHLETCRLLLQSKSDVAKASELG
jgi:hypothetical protein